MSDEKKLCLSGKGVTKVFGVGRRKTVAVDHVDFNFYEGEIISIVGESGSGKTTLAKMLLGLINETEGTFNFRAKSGISGRIERKRNTGKVFKPSFRTRSRPTTPSTRLIPSFWIVFGCAVAAGCPMNKK